MCIRDSFCVMWAFYGFFVFLFFLVVWTRLYLRLRMGEIKLITLFPQGCNEKMGDCELKNPQKQWRIWVTNFKEVCNTVNLYISQKTAKRFKKRREEIGQLTRWRSKCCPQFWPKVVGKGRAVCRCINDGSAMRVDLYRLRVRTLQKEWLGREGR